MTKINKFLKEHYKGELMKGPLLAIQHYLLPLPKSYKGDRRIKCSGQAHKMKPDGDNLEKLLNDGLKGALWHDDAQVSVLFRTKSTTSHKEGGTILFVKELNEGAFDFNDIINEIQQNLDLDIYGN